MSRWDRSFKFSVGAWGRKERKLDLANKRRNTMKEETAADVDESCDPESLNPLYMAECIEMMNEETPFIDIVEAAGRDLEIERLKNELAKSKKEAKRWKAKADYSFRRWLDDFGWRSHLKKDMSLDELKEHLLEKWEGFKNAGE